MRAAVEGAPPERSGRAAWSVVGLLWFCGFFNYADRQAVTSVFPLLVAEYGLNKRELGMLGSAFMVVYALMAPLAGVVVDRFSRRTLIVAGLAFWSVVCAATGLARSFGQLLFYRAAEGLGESFYFPASMSLLADYHGPRTRSRAMSVHQTSVYAGTALGGWLAGYLGQRFGWQSPFWLLGLLGLAYAVIVLGRVAEPIRAGAGEDEGRVGAGLAEALAEILRTPAAVALLVVFAGANFVAMALLTWLTSFVKEKFPVDLTRAATVANLSLQAGSFAGVLIGGALADRAARSPGGRARVQAGALLLGAPCVLWVGTTGSLNWLVVALFATGACKGAYDANIFASVYDVVGPRLRGRAAGLMNTVGWTGGSLAPVVVGWAGDRHGLGAALGATAAVYVAAGLLALGAAGLAHRGMKSPEGEC